MQLEESSKVFFAVFLTSVAISLTATFLNIVVLKHYNTFTDPENVPSPTDAYRDLFNLITGEKN